MHQEGREEDVFWIRKVLAGDVDAFRPLVQAYQHRLYSMAMRFMRNAQEAEDMVQETFVRTHKSLGSFRQNEKFSTWIFTICANLCKSAIRRQKIVRFLSFDSGDGSGGSWPEPQWASSDKGPEVHFEQQEKLESLHKEIMDLPDPLRLPLVLRTFEDMDDEDIANILALSLSNVRVRIHRAKTLLKSRTRAGV